MSCASCLPSKIMPSLKALGRLFAMMVGANLTYRFDIFIWTLAEAATPLVAMGIWYVAAQQGAITISPQETITYFIFIMFARSAANTWISFLLAREILTGEIARFLVRPLSVFWEHIADNLTVKILRLGLPSLILILLVAWRPAFLSPVIYEPVHALLFIISLVLGMVLAFVFDAIFALFAFWLEDSHEVARFQQVFMHITTGVLIPYVAMPPLMFSTLQWLPFRYMVSVPVELLLGQIQVEAAPLFLLSQVGWICFSIVVVSWLWRRGLKRYVIPGQ